MAIVACCLTWNFGPGASPDSSLKFSGFGASLNASCLFIALKDRCSAFYSVDCWVSGVGGVAPCRWHCMSHVARETRGALLASPAVSDAGAREGDGAMGRTGGNFYSWQPDLDCAIEAGIKVAAREIHSPSYPAERPCLLSVPCRETRAARAFQTHVTLPGRLWLMASSARYVHTMWSRRVLALSQNHWRRALAQHAVSSFSLEGVFQSACCYWLSLGTSETPFNVEIRAFCYAPE